MRFAVVNFIIMFLLISNFYYYTICSNVIKLLNLFSKKTVKLLHFFVLNILTKKKRKNGCRLHLRRGSFVG